MMSTMSRDGRRGTAGTALKAGLGAARRVVGSMGRGGAEPAPSAPPLPRPGRDGTVEAVAAAGETVADLAARVGVSTASVLALNGLSWRDRIAPGQVLLVKPSVRPEPVAPDDLHRHRVQDGETVSIIAERHGVATAAVLLANGLSRGSMVRAGQQLVVPVPNLRRSGSAVVKLTGEMRENALAVVAAGRAARVPDDAVVVALAAAMQDSSLHNLAFGDGDAVGLFQQRPSAGWGSPAALLDPYRAAAAFFGGPGSGVVAPAAGLLDVPGWAFMSIGEAAAAVQRTGTAAAYGKWERCAREWLRDLRR